MFLSSSPRVYPTLVPPQYGTLGSMSENMLLPAIPDTALAMMSRLLLTTTIAALSSTCWTMQRSLLPTRLSHQTALPSQVWWRLTCHLRIPEVGQLAAACLGISKLLRQLLITDFRPTTAPTQRRRYWSRGEYCDWPSLPLPPVFLRPRETTSSWPDSFKQDGFPRNPHAVKVWAGQPWKWTQAQRQQWEDTIDAQSTHPFYLRWPSSQNPPPATPHRGFLARTQFSWNITGITFNYARDRFCGDDLFVIDRGDSDTSDTDDDLTPWHIRQNRLAKYRD
jgi:hypothetical protein